MRVLHVIDSGGLYGAEMVLLNLAIEQQKMGIEPVIASMGERHIEEKPLERAAGRLGIRVEKFRFAAGPNIPGALKILEFARKEKCDILHSHGYKGNILLGFMPDFLKKIPTISTIHGWTNTGALNRMRLYEWLDGVALKRLDGVVLVSKKMKTDSKLQKVNPQKIFVIPNGIGSGAVEEKKEVSQDILDFCRQKYVIGAIGRLSPEKGFNYLLEAFLHFVRCEKSARLIIIGEGGERRRLEGLIWKYGLMKQVLLPGFRPWAIQYLPLFDLFILPSLTEGLPIAILEALQVGVPVLATRVGGIPEVLRQGEAGELVSPGDAQALTTALLNIYRNPHEAQRKAASGKILVHEHFSSAIMAEGYCNIYEQVLAGSHIFTPRKGQNIRAGNEE